MKKTYTTIDLLAVIEELKELVVGLRVNQIYDIDHKTYLIKLQKPDHKVVLLLESASRIHTTEYEWPKSPAPSGFSMKLRKHLRNKRLEKIEQLGVDRIVDMTFGSGEAAEHLILELYDRGNIVLTDGEYIIQNILRPRKEGEDTRLVVGQKYPLDNARSCRLPPSLEEITKVVEEAKENTPLKKILNPLLDCGGGVLEHELLSAGFLAGAKIGKESGISAQKVHEAASKAQGRVADRRLNIYKKGYIIKKRFERAKTDGSSEDSYLYEEFHPELYKQHESSTYEEFPSFNKACDEFFSNLESHEVDKKVARKEKEALKKLENVRKDHEKRLQMLRGKQEEDRRVGQLIELNQQLIESALLVIRNAIANQVSWNDIQDMVNEAQSAGDPVASAIKVLKLKSNIIVMWLSDPYDFDEDDLLLDSDEEREETSHSSKMRPTAVDIHLDESAMANARRYYNMNRHAAKKQQKTMDASLKAMKSAEKKTQQTLKEVNAIASINKARKVHWFEKYLWFVSSENYLVLGGKDGQQNEQVVKRHLKPKDVYVHADLHGASSVIIKNPTGLNVPPRTLHEAGIMALCNSRAWDMKVVTSAWWVWGSQVSKTAPSGEYLTTGAFMVRGKKNFLPPSHLIYGFGFMFRLEESSISRHANERKVKNFEPEESSADDEKELSLGDDDDESEEEVEGETGLPTIEENQDSVKVEDEESLEGEPVGHPAREIPEGDTKTEDDFQGLGEPDFPDTELRVSHLKGDRFTLKVRGAEPQESVSVANESRQVFLGDDEPVIVGPERRKGKGEQKQSNVRKEPTPAASADPKTERTLKRGQKGKLKKMTKKYKDQDEEDRELIMQFLQPDGAKKVKKKDRRKLKKGKPNSTFPQEKKAAPVVFIKSAEAPSGKENAEIPDLVGEADDGNVDEDSNQVLDDLSIVNALTALPVAEDEILYAIPVCAPYAAMANFKFKVKLTPGTGKKGKACKSALGLFLGDRSTSGREKDLIRAVKDHDLAKNVPGKVKISAPNMSKLKKN